ncbi:MAG: hypothetical protein IKN49_02415, partial [Elusimicrobiaceae bacterium]|nr:hypothetical protein [Elusimicrobiaceae bacterium]
MNNADLTFALVTPNNTADPNVIRVTNSKLPNVRLASYLDDNPKFAGQLHCEALKNDERANRLCGKLLMGQELTEQDGYVGYLLDQEITKDICGNASRSWSSSKTKCYKDTATRCSELGMGVITGLSDQCGYNGGKHTIGAEGMCYALNANSGCANSTISEGGVCKTEGGHYSCPNLYVEKGGMCIAKGGFGCPQSTFNGGICVGNADYACSSGTFTNHSICYANNANSFCDINHAQFKSSYDDTSCCCGAYCGNAPVCPAGKCAEALEKINASGYL